MTLSNGQKGFAATEALLVVIILGMVGFTGYYVWHAARLTQETLNAASRTAQSSPEKKTKNGSTITNPLFHYLLIKEWGIKVGFEDADKTTYRVGSSSVTPYQYANLLLKSNITSISNCQVLGITIARDSTSSADSDKKRATVSGHSYVIQGNGGVCADGTPAYDGPINQLRAKIFSQEFGQGTYTITAAD